MTATGGAGKALPEGMTLAEVGAALNAEVLGSGAAIGSTVDRAFSADLMSDVLRGLAGMIFVNGRRPEGVPVMLSLLQPSHVGQLLSDLC